MKTNITFFCIIMNFAALYAQKPFINKDEVSASDKWELVWADEFSSPQDIDINWTAENKAPSHILSSRWRENATIKRGKLYLNNRKESKGGRMWTSASLTCKEMFKYGYFECRMKISGSDGINNSFWMYQSNAKMGNSFEIDIAEAHYPNIIQTNIHDLGNQTEHYNKQYAKKTIANGNLYNKFHIYAMDWNKDSISFYFDGKLIRTIENQFCQDSAYLILGTAVLEWAGKITDAIDKTHMVVDYVRVYNRVKN